MSSQRDHSPRYRRFPWDEPDFDPQKVVDELDRMPEGRQEAEEHWDYGEETYQQQQQQRMRQYPHHERRSEEAHHRRRESPYHDSAQYSDGGEPRRRDKFRENSGGKYEDRRWKEQTRNHPQNSYPEQREPGWRRDEERTSRDRFRDRSLVRHEEHRQGGGAGRGRQQQRNQSPNMPRRRPNQQQDRNQQFKRNRREMDGSSQFGYGREEQEFEQHYSEDERREGYKRNTCGPHKYAQNQDTVEQPEPSRREGYSRDRDFNPRQRSSRSVSRDDNRSGHFEVNHQDEGYREPRRSPFADHREIENYTQNRDVPENRGGAVNFNRRGGFNRGGFNRGGRGAAQSNRPQMQQQREQHPSPQNERPRSPFREEFYEEREPAWEQRDHTRESGQTWRENNRNDGARGGGGGGGGEVPNLPRRDNLPRQDVQMRNQPREQQRSMESKPNMMVITEETLTIKVDMSRPVNKNSSMLYSSDRQLSLDLVNVGRQRLDFLPMLEHSGSYRENTAHTGTFAQEIITLVHHVKDQYFGGEGIPLSERFSAPQKKGFVEEEPHEMTLSERFGSQRGLNINTSSLMDSDEHLLSRQDPMQRLGPPARDPDDLRHDLERRRAERLEEVTVTIAGHSLPQRPPMHQSEQTYNNSNEMSGNTEFSQWSEEPNRRQEGPMVRTRSLLAKRVASNKETNQEITTRQAGQANETCEIYEQYTDTVVINGTRRGGNYRHNGPFRRNNRQMRRPNYRHNNNNTAGPNW